MQTFSRGHVKILILATGVFSGGGIEQYTRNIFSAMKEIYGTTNVHIGSFLPPENNLNTFENKLAFKGQSKNIFGKVYFGLRGFNFIKNKKIDIIFCNHVSLSPIAYLAKKLFGVRYLVSAHGIEVWGNLRKRDLIGLRNADLILPVSKFTEEILHNKHGIPDSRMFLLRNCVDVNKFTTKEKNSKLIKKYDLKNKKVLLSVGRLSKDEKYKGHDTIIKILPEIIKSIPNIVYLIVGEGDDRKRLEKLVVKKGIENNVIFAGFVENEILVDYYNLCDVFILPSKFGKRNGKYIGEGFGIVYLEAASYGKPVIAGKYGGSAEAVINEKTGFLVDPYDLDNVKGAIMKLMTNEKLAKEMGIRGKEWVKKEFSCEKFPKKLKRILETLEK